MIPPDAPLRLLLGIYGRQAWRRLLGIREQSRLLTVFIAFFMLGYAALSFALFRMGLRFIGSFPGLGGVLTERLMFLLFAFLFFMLFFSNLAISYTNFFRNRETQFLMTLPIPFQTVFRFKFIESTALASWAFLYLIAPLLAAYGMAQKVPWDFYLITLILLALFIFLPAIAAAWCAINLARFLDRRRFQVLLLATAASLIMGAVFWLKPQPLSDDKLETRVLAVLDTLMDKTRFAQFPWLPSYWLSSGVLHWAEGARSTAGFFLLMLLSNVLFFGFWITTETGKMFYAAASEVQSRSSVLARWSVLRRRRAASREFKLGPRGIERFLGWLPGQDGDVRALVAKDLRMFWRDTAQWGQTLVLFGLLGVYVVNLRHFAQQLTNPYWVHLVSYLNLGACALNLATLTTRFVFPQFSLEGKRVWIIGLAPIGLQRVVQVKYRLATFASLAITVTLMLLSCAMLKMPRDHTAFFLLVVATMTFTLNGLALGLGTLYPNFKEDNPSKIVSGFGGTFCLILSFLYIAASVALLASGSPWSRGGTANPSKVAIFWTAYLALSACVGWIPYRLGMRKLARFEL